VNARIAGGHILMLVRRVPQSGGAAGELAEPEQVQE
jgi:hypothetical protein